MDPALPGVANRHIIDKPLVEVERLPNGIAGHQGSGEAHPLGELPEVGGMLEPLQGKGTKEEKGHEEGDGWEPGVDVIDNLFLLKGAPEVDPLEMYDSDPYGIEHHPPQIGVADALRGKNGLTEGCPENESPSSGHQEQFFGLKEGICCPDQIGR